MSVKDSENINKSKKVSDATKANMSRKKKKPQKTQVLGADGKFHDLSDDDHSSEEDSEDDDDSEEDDDDVNKSEQHMKYLTKCRCLHLAVPVHHYPVPTLLLHPPSNLRAKNTGKVINNVCHFSATDILRNLHLKHCGLVFLSRGATASGVTIANSASSLRASRSIGLDICDTLLYAGAQSVVAPLWSDESNALATVLVTAKFYDDVVDCADEMRPVAVAMRHACLWLRDATFGALREFMWSTRIDRLLLEEIDDELWSVALAQKMLKGQGKFGSTDDRWDRVQNDARPFASPFYWATFRCVGSCTGLHDPRIAERDDFNDFKENAKLEKYLDEFHLKDGEMSGMVEKGAKLAREKMAEPMAIAERKLKEKIEVAGGVKADLEIHMGQRVQQARLKGEAARDAVKETRGQFKDVRGAMRRKIEKGKEAMEKKRRKKQADKIKVSESNIAREDEKITTPEANIILIFLGTKEKIRRRGR